MSLNEYKGWNVDQVKARYKELRKELFDLRMKAGLNQLTSYSKVKKTRREIARLLTFAKREKFGNIR